MQGSVTDSQFVDLYRGGIIPLNTCLPGLTWVLHDYLITVQHEVKYVWPRKMTLGKFLFLWIRYYGILLLIFDVAQIHTFAIPGIRNDAICVAMDFVIRIVGALLLWPIEIIMQMRIYALYKNSKKVAFINLLLFAASIGTFMWILIHNAVRRESIIANAMHLPLPGCPSIHSGIEWLQWIPATVFEGILFGWVLYQSLKTSVERWRGDTKISLYSVILRDNILYFFGITCLLVFNNLMVVGTTKIPWLSYSPFHAAMEIMTSRMLINMYKASGDTNIQPDSFDGAYKNTPTIYNGPIIFVHDESSMDTDSVHSQSTAETGSLV